MNSVIGARLNAGLAANAGVFVKLNNPIVPLVHGGCGADAHTGGVLTVIAAGDLKVTGGIWVLPGFRVFDPGAMHANGNIVFALTGRGASMTTYAFAVVDYKSIFHLQLERRVQSSQVQRSPVNNSKVLGSLQTSKSLG
jgi:hypothetical protein